MKLIIKEYEEKGSIILTYFNYNQLLQPYENAILEDKFRKMQLGDQTARDELIEHNLRFVIYIVQSFNLVNYESDYDINDLLSIGTIGLIKAIDTFDIDKGIHLSTYARRYIKNEILMYFRSNNKRKNDISIYSTFTEKDPLNNFVKQFENKETHKEVRKIVEELPEREKYIIMLRFGFIDDNIMTQEQIAKELGVSQSYVSRTIRNVLRKIEFKLKIIGIVKGVYGGIAIDTNPPKIKVLS